MLLLERTVARVLVSLALGLMILSSAAGQRDQRLTGASPGVRSGDCTTRHVVTGCVVLPDRSPAVSAVVVASAGGQAATKEDGRFELAIDIPRGVETVRLTAASGSNLVASAPVALSLPNGVTDAGTLVLAATTSCEPSWLPTFGQVPGTDAGVYAFAVFDDGSGPALYAGGDFTAVASHVAKWDGTRWSALGNGVNGRVSALVEFDDGSGPALYAAGGFLAAGSVVAKNIAKWDGTTWSPVGGGMSGGLGPSVVTALAVFDDGSGPALIAGGEFTRAGGVAASRIAKWNGVTWSPLGNGVGLLVNAITVFDDGSGPALYAAGYFTTAGSVAANRIAKWDGASWSPLGGGLSDYVQALAVFDDGSGPALYAGGRFLTAGGVAANRIAKWDGATWSALGLGVAAGGINTLMVFDDGSGPALFAGGGFIEAGAVVVNDMAKWDGTTWSALGSGIGGIPGRITAVFAMTVFDDGTGPALIAGGDFATAGGLLAHNIGRWNGADWSWLGPTPNTDVTDLTVFDDGSGPALYAARVAPMGEADNIAKWNGASWTPLGSGMNPNFVLALAAFDDGSGPALYAGGIFATAGGVAANNIAKWNGASWAPLGSGTSFQVSALAVFDDGSGPALYAGGLFATAGGVAAQNIARWNGTTWSALGDGLNGGVHALTVFDDGGGPALYAGGDFTLAGGMAAQYIAKWNGTTWSPLGSGMTAFGFGSGVSDLTVFDDGSGRALYAGGRFMSAGGVIANHIAKWNGASWAGLGGGVGGVLSPAVYALAVFDDGSGPALYAGGDFLVAGEVTANRIAKWDGVDWSPLGSGMRGPQGEWISTLAVFDDGTGPALYAGGSFTNSPASDSYLAKWGCTLPAGARTYGASSPGCAGPLAIGVTSPPRVGNAAFAITCGNTPPSAPGALLAGTALTASLPILDIQVWVNPIALLSVASSASGSTAIPLPLPPDPTIAGVQLGMQLLWLGPTAPPPCPPAGLSASNALELTIQP